VEIEIKGLGVVGFFVLDQPPAVVSVVSVLLGIISCALVACTSRPAQRFFACANDSWSEAGRVVWPTRKETTQMTLIVFAFVVVMAIFLWLVDQGLQWFLYDLLLGWK